MVTKLKNSRKCAIFFMIAVAVASAVIMVSSYPMFAKNMSEKITDEVQGEEIVNLADELMNGLYFLYNQVYEQMEQSELVNDFEMDDFLLLRKYMDYEIFDFKGNALLDDNNSSTVKKLVGDAEEYAFHASIIIDEDGKLRDVQVDGDALDGQESYRLEQAMYEYYDRIGEDSFYDDLEYFYELIPKEVKVIYGMSKEQITGYMSATEISGYKYAVMLSNESGYLLYEWILVLIAAVLGILIAANRGWRVYEWKLFHAPLEVVLFVCALIAGKNVAWAEQVWNMINGRYKNGLLSGVNVSSGVLYQMQIVINLAMWVFVFGIVLWAAICISEVFVLKKDYLRKRTLCAKIIRWGKSENGQYGAKIKQGAGFFQRVLSGIRSYFHKVYDEFLHIDLQENSNRMIIKALSINFFLLLIITCLWFYGIFALIIYSVILFFVLKRYSQDIKRKYALLLESTNLLAEGNLDAPIEGDLGIFNPIKTEIQKIQKGLKKAVQEEVKSERMKTELITNVSHDLKTPLTAIITYVDLLKSEEDPEKCKEYLEVLEKKSLRLKVLIEDLFEISKAASKNVTMNFMKIDIVGLLKQVGLECEEKIKAANLEFRWNLPGGKIIMLLDSQKTYRIFENLIVNITKYALPHTRVYIELTEEEGGVSISMKNISAAELNFNTDEITDRFVRGDASRNTEGSGLGLAIAKSFTELQFGTLQVSTEADLFKVVIRLPKRSEEPEKM